MNCADGTAISGGRRDPPLRVLTADLVGRADPGPPSMVRSCGVPSRHTLHADALLTKPAPPNTPPSILTDLHNNNYLQPTGKQSLSQLR